MKPKILIRFSVLLISFLLYSFVKTDVYASTISLDQAFGIGGKIISNFNSDTAINHPQGATLISDGKIIVTGYILNGSNYDWVLARYNSDGSIDASFGNNGKTIFNLGGNDFSSGLAVQSDGKIIVSGYSYTDHYQWKIARFNSNGTIDNGFGNNGIITSFDGVHSLAITPLLQSDGKIIGVGFEGGSPDSIAIARYHSDGSPDINFGNNGIFTQSLGIGVRGMWGSIQQDGKIIVTGEYSSGATDEAYILRITTDGILDATFGNNGITTRHIGTNGADRVYNIKLQSDQKIILSGGTNWNFSSDPSADTYLARFNPNGSPDASFGINGIVIQNFSDIDVAGSLFLQQDGKIVIGGYEKDPSVPFYNFAIRRFNTDGSLDSTFGTNGSFTSPTGSNDGAITSILQQNDGKILLAGYASNGSYNNWLLARFTTSEPSPDINQNVPLLKQTSNPWKKQVYDSAKLWNPIDPSINSWGCALTSAAMVFKYHGINKLPNNKPLDPGTLNTWLRSQKDGYIGNGFINWLALSRLSKLAKNINGLSFDALEYSRNNGNSPEILLDNLENNLPGILSVPGHFVVAKGIEDNIFTINDPYYPRTSLSDYGNTFQNLGTYTPSNTDLSYIMITTNPNTQIELQDSDGDVVGETIIEDPIVNPEDPEQKNESLKILYLPKPSDTSYNLVITSSGNYEVKIYLYDKNGEVFTSTETGTLPPEQTKIIPINFNGQENLYEKRTTYILTTLEIEKLFLKKQITSRKVKKELEEVLARAAIQKVLKNDEKQLGFLREFEDILNENKGTNILPHAYETLLYNVNYLSSNL